MITHTRRITVEISDTALALIAAGGKDMALALGLDARFLPMLQITSQTNEKLATALLAQQLLALKQSSEIREFR